MRRKFADTFGFLLFVFRRWKEDRCPQIAGSLTYTTLLALVPIFTIVVALLSTTPFFGEVIAKIKLFLRMNLLPDIADTITNVYMLEFAHNARRLTAAGVAGVFIVAVWRGWSRFERRGVGSEVPDAPVVITRAHPL